MNRLRIKSKKQMVASTDPKFNQVLCQIRILDRKNEPKILKKKNLFSN